jgi:ABC-type Zn uptake system ZnuABC Zn-binding protein ZnuA
MRGSGRRDIVKRKLLFIAAGLSLAAGFVPDRRACATDDGRIHVVTTLSVLRYVAEEVGGDRVEVRSLSNPLQDPHYVQPRPTLMKAAREADVFVEIGLQLEPWAQNVIDGSANPAIQTGQPGRVIASEGISTLELPSVLSREWGDVHPYGNPHVWLDPVQVRRIAANIAAGLIRVDPAGREVYEANLADFQGRLDVALFGRELADEIGGAKLVRLASRGRLETYLGSRGLDGKLGGWLKKAEPLRGESFVTYHKTWVYFARRFGLEIPVEIEEKPGITPSARHRDHVIRVMKSRHVPMIVISRFYDRSAADYVSEETGAPVLSFPIDTGAVPGTETYFGLVDYILDGMLAVVGGDEP